MQVQNIGRHFPVGVEGGVGSLLFWKSCLTTEIWILALECVERCLRPIEANKGSGESNSVMFGDAVVTTESILEHLGIYTGEAGIRALAFFGRRTLRLG